LNFPSVLSACPECGRVTGHNATRDAFCDTHRYVWTGAGGPFSERDDFGGHRYHRIDPAVAPRNSNLLAAALAWIET